MTSEQQKLLEKAARSLSAAKNLNQDGYPEFSVSRAYYCMFYIKAAQVNTHWCQLKRKTQAIP
ncbi:MAG: HEPN domain-containing protein [Coleofasciculus sp. C2-GNP5-27]